MEQELRRHNEMVLRTLEEGDLVKFDRGVFSYWGVYIGDGTIVHIAGVDVAGTAVDSSMSNVSTISETGYRKVCVKRDNFWDVVGSSRVIKNNNKDRITLTYPRRIIQERALSRLGPASYSVLWENSEHFACWCRYGIALSDQLSSEIIELDVTRHNQTVLGTLKEGDLVEFDRGIYSHWGVYIGDETIVHLTGLYVAGTAVYSSMSNVLTLSASGYIKACVKRDKFWDVAGSSRMIKNNNKDRITLPYPGRDIKERALSRLGPASYSVLWKNCEHFASWCRYGRDQSDQAEAIMTWVGGFILGASLTGVGAFVYAGRTHRNYRRLFLRRIIKERALSSLGTASCSDLLDNCEQFGIAVSDQADAAMTWDGGFVLGASLTRVEGLVYATQTDRNDRRPFLRRKTKERALSRLQTASYSDLMDICEQFGIAVSDQADAAMTRAGAFFLGASLTGFGGLVYAARTDRNYRRKIKERALSRLGTASYSDLLDNCEQFGTAVSDDQADAAMTWVGGFVLGASLTHVEGLVYATLKARYDRSCESGLDYIHGSNRIMFGKVYCRADSDCTMLDNLHFAAVTRYGTQASGRYYIDRWCSTVICGIMNLLK